MSPGGGGGALPYISYLGMCLLGLFSLKTGIDFAHFCLEAGVVFEGTTGVYECIYCFNS